MKEGRPIALDFSLAFQMKYCLSMVAGSLFTSLALFLYLDRRLGEGYFESLMTLRRLEESLPVSLVVTFGIQFVLILLLTVAINLYVSHKIGGPMYRIELGLKAILDGDLRHDVVTRDGDQLKSMVASLNGWQEATRTVFAAAQRLQEEVDRALERVSSGQEGDFAAVRRCAEDVRRNIGPAATAGHEGTR